MNPYPFPTGVVPRNTAVEGEQLQLFPETAAKNPMPTLMEQITLSSKYPKYYKDVTHLKEIDIYQVHQLFNIEDPSGALQHASKKLLLSGVRTGGKSKFHDIREARDTLNRWLEINDPASH